MAWMKKTGNGRLYGTGKLFADDDGYVTFIQTVKDECRSIRLTWHCHAVGWEAFVHGSDEPVFSTGSSEYPSDEQLDSAADAM